MALDSSPDILARIAAMPPAQRAEALRLMKNASLSMKPKGKAVRNLDQFRKFFKDPWKFMRDALGYIMSGQQERAIEMAELYDRLLILSGNNLGKTFIISGYGLYRYVVVAAMPDEFNGLEEQGCRLLLPGPDHDTIFATVYSELLAHATRAEARGYPMPGDRSERSVLWPVRPRWEVEAFAPRKDSKNDIAHTASGRHHMNQIAIIEEGQGVDEPTWAAAEGMCSTDGNKIISSLNPSNPAGSVWTRLQSGAYHFIHLDAFSHPNVRQRSNVIPAAISYKVVDSRVRTDCRERGDYPEIQPDPEWREFVYALMPLGTVEKGPRADGHLGHPDGPLKVYRPNPGTKFEPQVLGQYPKIDDKAMFDPGKVEEAMLRASKLPPTSGIPDMIGWDFARTGGDDICGMPRWGKSADELLRAYWEVLKLGDPDQTAEFVASNRIRVGKVKVVAQGEGDAVAKGVVQYFPKGPLCGDIGGVGASPIDFLRSVHKRPCSGISFSSKPPANPPGISSFPENMRAWMYMVASRVVALGLIDIEDDPLLKQELIATEAIHREKTVKIYGKPKSMPSVIVLDKDEIKKKIGRSPDRADAFVMSLTTGFGVRPRVTWLNRPITKQPR